MAKNEAMKRPMFCIRPSDAILEAMYGASSRYYMPGEWWLAYEWFCRKVLEREDRAYEMLNATSSINNFNFWPMGSQRDAVERLAYLFKRVGRQSFLSELGYRTWADLNKPISFNLRKPKWFPRSEWFKLHGKRLTEIHNKCHPKAVSIHGFTLRFDKGRERWVALLQYGYPNDASSWTIEFGQDYRETLDHFAGRIDRWLDRGLVSERDDGVRLYREQVRRRAYQAVDDLFWGNHFYDEDKGKLADELAKRRGRGVLIDARFILNQSRLATLKRWAREGTKG